MDSSGNGAHAMTKIAIIGAGLAGLTLARHLVAAGLAVTLFDKGRGVGGRCATRRTDWGAFDHGLQVLDPRDPGCQLLVALSGLSPELTPRGDWRIPGGASALPKALAHGLDVRLSHEIKAVTGQPGAWQLMDAAGSTHGTFDWVVFTAPPLQSRALWPGEAPPRLAHATMAPCWAAMLVLDTPHTGASGWLGGEVVEWAVPADADGCRWVLHASSAWTRANLEADASSAALALWQAYAPGVSVAQALGHRWRYARPEQPLGQSCLIDHAQRLAACGDWCLGPGAGFAFESAAALALALANA
jgi:renalase